MIPFDELHFWKKGREYILTPICTVFSTIGYNVFVIDKKNKNIHLLVEKIPVFRGQNHSDILDNWYTAFMEK